MPGGVTETGKVDKPIDGLQARTLAFLAESHDLNPVLRLADRVYVLRRGEQECIRTVAATDKNGIASTTTGVE